MSDEQSRVAAEARLGVSTKKGEEGARSEGELKSEGVTDLEPDADASARVTGGRRSKLIDT